MTGATSLPPIQALMFDVDKTLTKRNKQITPHTVAVLQQLVREGKYTFGLCTGRAPATLESILALFPPEAVHVFNGGGTLGRSTGEILEEILLPSELVREIATRCEQLGSDFEVDNNGKIWVNERKLGHSSLFHDARELTDWSTALLCIQQINDDVRELVGQYDDIQVKEMVSVINGPYVDITVKGVTKVTGLHKWSNLAGIPLDTVAGFGDSENDLEFLQAVGWPVAMGNSVPAVKAIAKEVIGDCDADGLAQYLEDRFL